MKTLILYTTSGCHLCEEAEILVAPVLAYLRQELGHEFHLRLQEISDSEALVEAYGLRIPVLQVEGSALELGWPFDQAQAFAFLQESIGS